MNVVLNEQVGAELDALREARTYKRFLTLESPQGPVVRMAGRGEVIILSSNNYLGLAGHPEVVRAGIEGLERYGAGTASVRFICGLRAASRARARPRRSLGHGGCADLRLVLERERGRYPEPDRRHDGDLHGRAQSREPDRRDPAFASGEEGHLPHSDTSALRDALADAPRARKLIVTDGVFSMEGDLAKLPEIVELAASSTPSSSWTTRGVGVLGETGRGTVEHFGLLGEVDVITGTLGKALGGAAGGYVAASEEVCDLARAALAAAALLERPPADRRLQRAPCGSAHARPARSAFTAAREHPPVSRHARRGRLPAARGRGRDHPDHRGGDGRGDRALGAPSTRASSSPGSASRSSPREPRACVQMSAALEPEHLERAIAAFRRVRPV